MAEPAGREGFLGRWSRLKRETRTGELPDESPVQPMVPERLDEAAAAVPAEIAAAPPAAEEEPDLSDLPPLDSLDAGSDYTGFLRRDVPEELRRQALRKAWASDPAIAGFRGFAEYDWDYNAPGYGALRPTDDIARLLDAVLPDEKREEEAVEEEVVVAEAPSEEEQGNGELPVDTTCPLPDPPPLSADLRSACGVSTKQGFGGGGGQELCQSATAVPPPPGGGG
ncbi:MAG: DUF3306 domain-containing protein [Alphaproteobacteria bacterium]